MNKKFLEVIFFGIAFVVLAIFGAAALINTIEDHKHKPQQELSQEAVQQTYQTQFAEDNPNVFVVEQDGLRFTFYVNEDPNVIDLYVTDTSGTHEFKHEGKVVEELHHTFVMQFDKDVDRNFVRRQYQFLINKFYKNIAFKYE